MRPHGCTERGSPTWHRLLKEGTVIGTAFDDSVDDAGHLGGNSGERLAPQIRVVPIASNVTLELVAEAVLPLANGHLGSEPQGAS